MGKLANSLKNINTNKLTDIIAREYKKQGYGLNDFLQNLHCDIEDTSLMFKSSEYAWYMLHGRGPGKRPPISSIKAWCEWKHIQGKSAPFLIARKIGLEGTKGNDFVTPVIPELLLTTANELKLKTIDELKTLI